MANLDHLKIKKAPAAFAAWARNFNSQVDLIASIQGGPGIDVSIAHSPRKVHHKSGDPRPKEQPRGKILMTLRPSAIGGIGVASGSTTNTTNVVSSDGTLVTVPLTTPNSGAYPTRLQTALNGNYRAIFEPTEVGPSRNDILEYAVLTSAGLEMKSNSTGKTVQILHAEVSQNITIREFTGCNSGSPANYLTIASDFY